jgi:hypothetical protein
VALRNDIGSRLASPTGWAQSIVVNMVVLHNIDGVEIKNVVIMLWVKISSTSSCLSRLDQSFAG